MKAERVVIPAICTMPSGKVPGTGAGTGALRYGCQRARNTDTHGTPGQLHTARVGHDTHAEGRGIVYTRVLMQQAKGGGGMVPWAAAGLPCPCRLRG